MKFEPKAPSTQTTPPRNMMQTPSAMSRIPTPKIVGMQGMALHVAFTTVATAFVVADVRFLMHQTVRVCVIRGERSGFASR
jgi:hypothetical protein